MAGVPQTSVGFRKCENVGDAKELRAGGLTNHRPEGLSIEVSTIPVLVVPNDEEDSVPAV
jgi:hypothetical protein